MPETKDSYREYLRKHSYVDRRLMDGDTRDVSFFQNGDAKSKATRPRHAPSQSASNPAGKKR